MRRWISALTSMGGDEQRLEQALRLALNRAVEDETLAAEMRSPVQKRPSGVSCEVVAIGNRPAGELAAGGAGFCGRDSRGGLRNLNSMRRRCSGRRPSANIPHCQLGLWKAIAIYERRRFGRRGAITLQEWFDSNGRELGLKRIILTMMALAGAGGGGMMRTFATLGGERPSTRRKVFSNAAVKRSATQKLQAAVELHFSQGTREMGHSPVLLICMPSPVVCLYVRRLRSTSYTRPGATLRKWRVL